MSLKRSRRQLIFYKLCKGVYKQEVLRTHTERPVINMNTDNLAGLKGIEKMTQVLMGPCDSHHEANLW